MQGNTRVLITGANGLLGSHTIDAIRHQCHVEAVVRQLPKLISRDVSYHLIDFSKNWKVADLPKSVDIIIHLAQSEHFREFPEQAMDVFQVNIESTARLLDYAFKSGAKKFIYASSGGVYGNGPIAFHENSSIVSHQKLGHYLGSKVCGEVLVQSYASIFDVIILRPFFMYGANQRRTMLIPRLVDCVVEGRPIILQGKDGIRINPVHVRDVVDVIKFCLTSSGSLTLNVAGPSILSIKEISEIIANIVNKKPHYYITNEIKNDLIGDNELMLSILDKELILLNEGILELIY
ncbi:NAD dependent epimerase/dehydratase family protein [Acaryochloris marina MBIC11017]|uniref:NAD dependent epimerase/dehydratase family protein n=2 Tax=Acaryochloris marina TaxID=155978 RepID=B0BZH1_ACAM1|nr:NAD dependent epimerase/dehydratase family protein [Acaryochloris marina MBIC11017]